MRGGDRLADGLHWRRPRIGVLSDKSDAVRNCDERPLAGDDGL